MAARPGISVAGFASDTSDDALERWISDDIPTYVELPVLFAHGRYDKAGVGRPCSPLSTDRHIEAPSERRPAGSSVWPNSLGRVYLFGPTPIMSAMRTGSPPARAGAARYIEHSHELTDARLACRRLAVRTGQHD